MKMEEESQIQNQLHFPMYRIPLFSFNPNSFPYMVTYEQPAVVMDGQVLLTLETDENGVSTSEASNIKIKTKGKLPTHLEKNADEVQDVLAKGCFCLSKNCLHGLDPDSVYHHRKSISKLTKAEHDMILMGAMTSCLTSYKGSAQKTYMRYMYKGQRVCKEAFLYLQLCTRQQLNEVRDHLVTYGVSSVTYPTYSSAKHSVFYTEAFKALKEFLLKYVEAHTDQENLEEGQHVFLPLGTSKKSLHRAYKEYMQKYKPDEKCMAYSTFRNILSEHFPQIVFYKFGRKSLGRPNQSGNTNVIQAGASIVGVLDQNDTVVSEGPSFLQIPDSVMAVTDVSKNSDSVESVSSDKPVSDV